MCDSRWVILGVFCIFLYGDTSLAMSREEVSKLPYAVMKSDDSKSAFCSRLTPMRRAQVVVGSAVVGAVGAHVLRKKYLPLDGVAQFVTCGHPVLFDVGCGAALGGAMWWVTGHDCVSTIDQLKHDAAQVGRQMRAFDDSLKKGFDGMGKSIEDTHGQIEQVSTGLQTVATHLDQVRDGVGQASDAVRTGFETSEKQMDKVEVMISSLQSVVSSKQEEEWEMLDETRQAFDGRADGLNNQLCETVGVGKSILAEQADITSKLVALEKMKKEQRAIVDQVAAAIKAPLYANTCAKDQHVQ